MQYSQIPAALTKAFAVSGDKNSIPTDASSSTLANGLAAFSSGFPPVTSLPAAAGGQNPVREDFNGLFAALTTIQQWQMTGAARQYESAFSTAIGGYPKMAVLVKSDSSGFWISTADNNTSNPDSGGANWSDLSAFLLSGLIDKLPTGTVDAMVASITLPPFGASLAGVPIFVRAIGANTSTTPTYTGKTIVKGNNLPLVAGDIAGAGHWLELQYDATLDKWVLQNPAYGVNTVTVKQIQTVGATVAANAMTVTLNPTSLDFRSTTLNSGAINTRANAAQLSLTIPSTATLGTTNGVASRILILAIDNAGTMELAVYNAAGGANLDETGVINTTAIAGGSNSLTVYSQTARTGVPYRIVGFVDSTQATAGTWATAPSLVQGCGGEALTSLASLGYGQSWQNVAGSRTLGTTYYNTTSRPILVSVTVNGTTGQDALIYCNGVLVCSGTSIYTSARGHACAIIPPGASYYAAVGGGGGSVAVWAELR